MVEELHKIKRNPYAFKQRCREWVVGVKFVVFIVLKEIIIRLVLCVHLTQEY